MKCVNLPGFSVLLRCVFAGLLWLAAVTAAVAAPKPLSDAELAMVSGQGFVILDNTVNFGGLDFSTVTLNADVTLNANFGAIQLGTYTRCGPVSPCPPNPNYALPSDINISALQFGRGPGGATTPSVVQISNPYLQFVYDHTSQQVLGLRLGFGGISGDIGLQASAISGTVFVKGTVLSGDLNATGIRWDNSGCVAPCLSLANIGDLTAGAGVGSPSRDFWISMLSQPVQFPAPLSGSGLPTVAQAGVWLNWTDRLTAVNTTGAMSPNKAFGH